ncbi:MAG: outer membrane beta-barrel protein [Verrucomicrobia bacterium]|nr:outer membrane beta-barrel protein [Deltaproteobacteria bacterium]
MFPDLLKCIVITILLVAAVPLPLLGDELKLIPGLALKEEFNDNIFLAAKSRRTDFITTLTPSLDISSASERHNLSLSTGINWLNYARNAGLDSVDYFAQSGLKFQFDPRLAISAAASYVRNSRPDRIDQNDLTLKSGSDRQSYQLSGSHAVSEKSTSTVLYAYSQESFDNPGVVTTRVHTVNIGQDYDLDRYMRKARLVGNLGYSRNLTDSSLVDNYTASLGLMKKIDELWNVSMNVGGRYTHSEFDVNTVFPTRIVSSKILADDQGWIGNLSINYNGEKTNGSLAFNHDVTAASGRNGTTERTGVSTNLSERFTREMSGFLGLGYSWNRSNQDQFSAQSIDEKNLTLTGGLRYDFSDYVSLEGNYRYNNIYFSQSSSQANQNVFMLRLTMRRDVMDL